MNPVERAVLIVNLEVSLKLWLDAIGRGEYTLAKRIMEWRGVARARLQQEG